MKSKTWKCVCYLFKHIATIIFYFNTIWKAKVEPIFQCHMFIRSLCVESKHIYVHEKGINICYTIQRNPFWITLECIKSHYVQICNENNINNFFTDIRFIRLRNVEIGCFFKLKTCLFIRYASLFTYEQLNLMAKRRMKKWIFCGRKYLLFVLLSTKQKLHI